MAHNRKHIRPKARGTRPHIWRTGPDPIRHKQYRVWLQQRNQALWRGEGWDEDLDFDRWLSIWGDQYHLRGRTRGTLCMTRCDWELPWSPTNVEIVTREEHARRQGILQGQGLRSPTQTRRRIKLGLPI